jgi:hypothetical protein
MLRRFQTTSEGWLPTSHPCFVDPHAAAVPGMPTVTDLPRLGAMGIVSMSCITGLARTSHWRRMRRIHAVYSSRMPAVSSPSPKWAGCITGTNAERPDKDSSTPGYELIPAARSVQYNNSTVFDSFTATIARATFSGHSSGCKLQLQLIYHRKAGLSRRGDLIVAFRVINLQNAADGIYERHNRNILIYSEFAGCSIPAAQPLSRGIDDPRSRFSCPFCG